MNVFGAMGSFLFGGTDGLSAYAVNSKTGRGGFGTTMGDIFWRNMTGTSALDSSLAGDRLNATALNMLGISPTMMAMYGSMGINPYAFQPAMMPVMPYVPVRSSCCCCG